MAASRKQAQGFGEWLYNKLSSHPIDRIETTLRTGREPSRKRSSGKGVLPISGASRGMSPLKRRSKKSSRTKSPAKGRR